MVTDREFESKSCFFHRLFYIYIAVVFLSGVFYLRRQSSKCCFITSNNVLSTCTPFSLTAITLAAMSSALGWSDDEHDSDEEPETPARKSTVQTASTFRSSDDDDQWKSGNSYFAEILADFEDEVGQ